MKIHCIGIGGIGVSSLAQYYLSLGYFVSGSDLEKSEITKFLEQRGVKVFDKQVAENITEDIDLVVHSPAVKKDNSELMQAKKYGIACKSYPKALGELTKEHFTIAVAGSHGKSTITAMTGLILAEAGLDPTVIVGTKVKEFGNSNFREGKSKYLVIEACEYDGSFLNYKADIVVLTGIDKEHLDYFKTYENEINEFQKFVYKIEKGGTLVVNKDGKGISELKLPNDINIKEYSLSDYEAEHIKAILKIPGDHNIYNSLAALNVANILNIEEKITLKSLSKFKGTWRRFEVKEVKINDKKVTLISDYAHHPAEILATFKAAKEKYPDEKVWCVFQPHQVQRTNYLWNEFVDLFKKNIIDNVVVTDIYDVAGREVKDMDREVSSKKLVSEIDNKNVIYIPFLDITKYINENVEAEDVLIIMGAGNIYKVAESF